MPECKEHIIALFNTGVLTIDSAEWYARQGYAIICHGGRVVDIVSE